MALQREQLKDGKLEMDHYYLCNYVPLTKGKDGLSRSLLRFKNRLEVDLSAWVECSAEVLKSMVPKGCVILRALGHEERVHTLSALDHVGVRLSEIMDCSYEPTLLKKSKDVPSLKSLNRADRAITLKDVYHFMKLEDSDSIHFLIIDDILTTGTTVSAIAAAIREQIPSAYVSVFTLAKADYDLQMNELFTFEAEHFIWNTDNWEVREEEVEYNEKAKLMRQIMDDSFAPIHIS